jgi:hypothetical protein
LDERDVTLVFCFSANEINSFPPFTGNNDIESMTTAFMTSFCYGFGDTIASSVVKTRVDDFIDEYSADLPFEGRVIIPKLQANADNFITYANENYALSSDIIETPDFANAIREWLSIILRTEIIPDAYYRMLSFIDNVRAGFNSEHVIYPTRIGIGELNTVFKLTYMSALELSSINNTIAKLAIRFNEPDPSNRQTIV